MKTNKISTTSFPTISILLFLLVSFSNANANCPPYDIPTIASAEDFNNIVYIDPSGSNGDGSIENPYNTLQGLDIEPHTAYLIKRGTVLHENINKVWDNNLVGAYGQGPKPIIESTPDSQFVIPQHSRHTTFRNLHITKSGSGGYDGIVSFGSPNVDDYADTHDITIAYCKVVGKNDDTGYYPRTGLGYHGTNITIYNNEIAYFRNNGSGIGGHNIKVIRNWYHKINMDGEDSNESTGDIIQSIYLYNELKDFYMAGNILDKSNAIWKYGLMLNYSLSDGDKAENIVVENNTFYAPKIGRGGAAVRWVAGPDAIFRKNVVNGIGLEFPIDTYDGHANRPEPYGIRDNHILREEGKLVVHNGAELNETNQRFYSQNEYETFLDQNPHLELYGSDIDTNDLFTPVCHDNPSFTVTFDVKNEEGANIENAQITLGNLSQPQGEYTFDNVAEGNYDFEVTATGYDDISQTDLSINENTVIQVVMTPTSVPTHDLNFNINCIEGNTIDNAVITLNGVTYDPGNYNFADLEEDTYTYSITAPDHEEVAQTIITLENNLTVQVNMTPLPPETYSVSFVVESLEGVSINDAIVNFDGNANPTGDYTFEEVVEGYYDYHVSATGFEDISSQGVLVDEDTTLEVVMTPLPPETYTVSFHITGSGGSEISNAVITFNNLTNEPGDYSYSGISVGNYLYTVSAPGYQEAPEAEVNVTGDTTISVEMNPEPQPTFTVTFDITDEEDNQLTEATVTFDDNTNPPGDYNISGVEEGIYEYQVSKTGYLPTEVTILEVSENTMVSVTLIKEFTIHTISLNAEPTQGGTLSGAGEYHQGETTVLTASPNQGYYFDNWTFESGEVLSSDNIIEYVVESDKTITANFLKQEHEVTLVASPTDAGEVYGEGIYNYNDTIRVTAIPYSGYTFSHWTIGDNIVSTESVYLISVQQSVELTAHFKPAEQIVLIETQATPNGLGFVTGGGEYVHGNNVMLEAVPSQSGFPFRGWFVDGEYIHNNPIYEFTATENKTVEALFRRSGGNFNVNAFYSQPKDQRNVDVEIKGSGTYKENEKAILEVSLPANIRFVGWRNSAGQIVARQNPYEFVVTRDIELEALLDFSQINSSQIVAYPNPSDGRFRVNINNSASYEVYSSSGIMIRKGTLALGHNEVNISEFPPGIYFMQITKEEESHTQRIIIK